MKIHHEMAEDRPNGFPEFPGSTDVTRDAVREQTKRILADPLFHNSHRAINLLKFIVERTLEGKNDDLKERVIGTQVFGRIPDYDTSNDPTVRVAASELRKRLAKYYSTVDHEQELRIDIPSWSYLAEFRLPPGLPNENLQELPIKPRRQALRRWRVWVPVVTIVLAIAVWVVVQHLYPVSSIDRFWAPVLDSPGPLLICIGSPLHWNEVPQELKPSPASASPNPSLPGADEAVRVGLFDARAAEDLTAYLRKRRKEFVVHPTKGSNRSDLRSGSIVLYGRFLNEWAVSLGADLHFRFREDPNLGLRWIEDTSNPSNKKWSAGLSASYEQVDPDYVLITRVQDQTIRRWCVGIVGLTGQGTLTANQMLIDPKAMSAIEASLPRGWDRKNLQFIIEIKMVQGNPGTTRVVASYAW